MMYNEKIKEKKKKWKFKCLCFYLENYVGNEVIEQLRLITSCD